MKATSTDQALGLTKELMTNFGDSAIVSTWVNKITTGPTGNDYFLPITLSATVPLGMTSVKDILVAFYAGTPLLPSLTAASKVIFFGVQSGFMIGANSTLSQVYNCTFSGGNFVTAINFGNVNQFVNSKEDDNLFTHLDLVAGSALINLNGWILVMS